MAAVSDDVLGDDGAGVGPGEPAQDTAPSVRDEPRHRWLRRRADVLPCDAESGTDRTGYQRSGNDPEHLLGQLVATDRLGEKHDGGRDHAQTKEEVMGWDRYAAQVKEDRMH